MLVMREGKYMVVDVWLNMRRYSEAIENIWKQ